ncbi:MAG: hypothetical protein EP329_21475 [Deltaproteobacteria bacterium]|nr:MAG: hypothetical protein EP329_21475 [Deltaproteobacteria bacterium]
MKRIGLATGVMVALLAAWVAPSRASILDFRQLVIDLTDAADARAKATWSEPGEVRLTERGLGWDADPASSWDGWIETAPLAVGTWWRPATGVGVRVALEPAPTPFTLANGQTTTPYKGAAFVRYSPDRVHWSTWQALEDAEGRPGAGPGRAWSSRVAVAGCEREEYLARLAEYQRRDVPWTSDEEAAVTWMVARDPKLFARHIPFVGYVQVRFEGSFVGGQRFTAMRVEVSAGIGGMSTIPKDPERTRARANEPWSFDARPRRERQER